MDIDGNAQTAHQQADIKCKSSIQVGSHSPDWAQPEAACQAAQSVFTALPPVQQSLQVASHAVLHAPRMFCPNALHQLRDRSLDISKAFQSAPSLGLPDSTGKLHASGSLFLIALETITTCSAA